VEPGFGERQAENKKPEPVRQKWTPVLAKDRRKIRNQSRSDASISLGQALAGAAFLLIG
jgi:hypothetical protein